MTDTIARYNADLQAANATAGCSIWNQTLQYDGIRELDRTQYAYARERRNDYLHALMNYHAGDEF